MALGIHKPGQGYWVRVLTATLVGLATLAASAWTYQQTALVAAKLPRSVWVLPLAASGETPVAGQSVTLLGKPAGTSPAPEIGVGFVKSFSKDGNELRINKVSMKDAEADPSTATAVKIGNAQPIAAIGQKHGEALIEPFLVQGMAMALVLLIGAVLAYWAAAIHVRFVEFLVATDGEMKKVNWSTKRDIQKSTMVVIFASMLLAASLFITDFSFQFIFKSMGVLSH
jgi:preprotein translocase SecE subunit